MSKSTPGPRSRGSGPLERADAGHAVRRAGQARRRQVAARPGDHHEGSGVRPPEVQRDRPAGRRPGPERRIPEVRRHQIGQRHRQRRRALPVRAPGVRDVALDEEPPGAGHLRQRPGLARHHAAGRPLPGHPRAPERHDGEDGGREDRVQKPQPAPAPPREAGDAPDRPVLGMEPRRGTWYGPRGSRRGPPAMADRPENIVPGHLKAIRAEQAGMRGDIRELRDRIADRPGRVGRRPGLTEDR